MISGNCNPLQWRQPESHGWRAGRLPWLGVEGLAPLSPSSSASTWRLLLLPDGRLSGRSKNFDHSKLWRSNLSCQHDRIWWCGWKQQWWWAHPFVSFPKRDVQLHWVQDEQDHHYHYHYNYNNNYNSKTGDNDNKYSVEALARRKMGSHNICLKPTGGLWYNTAWILYVIFKIQNFHILTPALLLCWKTQTRIRGALPTTESCSFLGPRKQVISKRTYDVTKKIILTFISREF